MAALSSILLLVAPVSPVSGQGWSLEASAGSAQYEALAGEVGTRNAMLGLRREGATWLYLSAGAPLDSAGIPWAAAGIGSRISTRPRLLSAGVDLGAHGFGYREPIFEATGWGFTLAGLPFVALSRGPARVELRSGILHHTSAFNDSSASRMVHDSGIRGWFSLPTGVVFSAEGRLVRAEEGNYPFATVAVEVPVGPGAVWARGGRWMSGSLDDSSWGIGARLNLPAMLTLRAAFQREADDPLYWNGARREWTVGLSRSLGSRFDRRFPLAIPAAVRPSAGKVALRIPIGEAREAPSVAGDFTDWKPVPMRRVGDFWEIRLNIPAGVHHYSFVHADGRWFVPESTPNRGEDGFGGVDAVLIVTSP
jgi:hypothetical protein